MKKIVFLLIISISTQTLSHAQSKKDSLGIEKNGWLLYWHSQIIWVEANINKKIDYSFFFRDSAYNNGLIMNGHYKSEFLKIFAHQYLIDYSLKNNLSKSNDDSILLLPIKAKLVVSGSQPSELENIIFYHGSRRIIISFRFLNNYSISEITALKSKDRKKIEIFLRKSQKKK